MASSTCSSSSSVPETVVFEGLEFSEANNNLLMALLMEETQEDEQDHDLHYADDDRLKNMIQSLEAEIISTTSHVGQVDRQDYSTSSVCTGDVDSMDMEVASASSSSSSPSPFDEDMIMSAWSPCAAGGDDSSDYYSVLYYGVSLENYSYLPQEASDVVF